MPVVTRAQKQAHDTKNIRASAEADADADSDPKCPVCDSVIDEDRAMLCSNGHAIDFCCVRKLVLPVSRTFPAHSGLEYRCPVCRDEVPVSVLHVFGLLRSSAAEAVETFPCGHALSIWQLDCYRGAPVRYSQVPH